MSSDIYDHVTINQTKFKWFIQKQTVKKSQITFPPLLFITLQRDKLTFNEIVPKCCKART